LAIARTFIRQIKKIVGEQHIQTDPEDLVAYSVDASSATARPPDVVVHPGSHDEVAGVVRAAAGSGIPVVARGAGTGLSGGSLAAHGGMLIAFDRMNRLIGLHSCDMTATVEPGFINWDLQQAAAAAGLFFPPDPSSAKFCTIGGNVAENASGLHGVKYGATGDYLLGLRCVLSSGESIRFGGSMRRNVTGYDVLHLIAGSEGTLAIITEITVRLLPKPASRRAALFIFDSTEAVGEALTAFGSSSVSLSALELIDHTAIECARQFDAGIETGEGAAILIIEVDGAEGETAVDIESVKQICQSCGGILTVEAASEEEVNHIWDIRRSVSGALGRRGLKKISEDISVPPSQVPLMLARINTIAKKHGVTIAVFGHAGAGNLHPNLLVDQGDPDEARRAETAISELFSAAVELGGSLSGEHGIGSAKAPYMSLVLGIEEMELMQRIKAAFDPLGVMNPGKIFKD